MTVDQLNLYNRALRHLKVRRLANLTESVTARYELDAVFPDVKKAMLERAGWKFAIRTSMLTADDSITPGFGLMNVFALPEDFVRWAAICVDSLFQVEDASFEEKNGLLYSNQGVLYVKYVSNGDDYGYDLGLFPDNYAEAFGSELAERTCLPITKDSGLLNDVRKENARLLMRAKNFDAIKEHVQFKPQGSVVTARSNGGMRGPFFRNGNIRF
jgi:hypothetical protein